MKRQVQKSHPEKKHENRCYFEGDTIAHSLEPPFFLERVYSDMSHSWQLLLNGNIFLCALK